MDEMALRQLLAQHRIDPTAVTTEPEHGYEPDPCPRCGADLNESRHADAHAWEGGCPR